MHRVFDIKRRLIFLALAVFVTGSITCWARRPARSNRPRNRPTPAPQSDSPGRSPKGNVVRLPATEQAEQRLPRLIAGRARPTRQFHADGWTTSCDRSRIRSARLLEGPKWPTR